MKPLPNWDIWKHVPTLKATEAVALTLNIEPHSIYESSKNKWAYKIGRSTYSVGSSFNDRLFLFKKCFGINGKISLNELAKWSQSVGWNIPIVLAELAPVPIEAPDTLPDETVREALAGIVVVNTDIENLKDELIKLNVQFILCDDVATIQIPDGTVNGKRVPLADIYSVACELCNHPQGNKLATLVRASGATGGGAPPGGGNCGWRDIVIEQQSFISKDALQDDIPAIKHAEVRANESARLPWIENARKIGKIIHKAKPSLSVEQIAQKTRAEMTKQKDEGKDGMTGRGGKIPRSETIKRHALTGIKS